MNQDYTAALHAMMERRVQTKAYDGIPENPPRNESTIRAPRGAAKKRGKGLIQQGIREPPPRYATLLGGKKRKC